jgi:hypothetical protein
MELINVQHQQKRHLMNACPTVQFLKRSAAVPTPSDLVAPAVFRRCRSNRDHRPGPRVLFGFALILIATGFASSLGLAADSGVTIERSETQLRVSWPISAEETGVANFSMDESKPLIESLGVAVKEQAPTAVMKALNPVTLLTVGSRDFEKSPRLGCFFDNTPRRPYETFLMTPGPRRVETKNHGTRTTVSLAEAAGGGFSGDVRFTFHRNSPLIHAETVMKTQEDWRAIIYDAGLESRRRLEVDVLE